MKWVQLPGTTLLLGEIHTNFSNLIFPYCVWPGWMVQQKDRSMEVQVTECVKETTARISKHYWRHRKKSRLSAFCDALWKGNWKQDCPLSNLSSHLAVQVNEKQMLVQGVIDSVLTESGSIWGRRSHAETNNKR